MAKHFVTTMNKKLFDDYGKDLLVSYMNTSQKYPIYVYVEDDISKYPIMKNVIYVSLFKEEPECEKFVKRNRNKVVASFMFDAVRFCYKVFAQCNASKHGGKMYYVDGDSVFLKTMDDEILDTLLPDKVCVSHYYRQGMYTETGFIGFNMNHAMMEDFIGHYRNLYIDDTVYNLPHYTDCHTFDRTRKIMTQQFTDDYYEKKLGDGGTGHIMARCNLIHDYLDHRKGKRKSQKHSPEWLRR
tara:strand:+ start:329 stop:1051 length:723 start_codon:yes stop_codon:yes gene_type:complete